MYMRLHWVMNRHANVRSGNRVRDMRQWLAAPDYMAIFESSKRHRAEETGNWILEDRTYLAWKSEIIENAAIPSPVATRVLAISGELKL